MRALLVACALVSSIGSLARAEPLDLREISARATWLAHIDFDAARDAKIAKRVGDGWLPRRHRKLGEAEKKAMRAQWAKRLEKRKRELLQKYDKNKDGKFDEAEKKAMRAQWARRHEERKRELLQKYDKNKDGKLDEAERKAMGPERARGPGERENQLLKATPGSKMMRDALRLHPPRELRSITLYGDRLVHGNGVVIVRAKVDRQQRLLAFLKKMPDYRTTSHGKHKLHTWTRRKGKRSKHTMTACFPRPAVTLFGRNAGEVKAALDVLDGKSPALAGGDSFLAAGAPEGSILQARAVGLAGAKLPFKSPIVHQSEAISVAIGEHKGEVFARAELVANSAEVANDIRAIVDGFLALTKLQHKSDEEALSVLRATKVTTVEKTVAVESRGANDHALKLLEEAWKKHPKPKRKD